jgi:hypothetical protein
VPRFTGDVAIHNGRIAEIGRIDATPGMLLRHGLG